MIKKKFIFLLLPISSITTKAFYQMEMGNTSEKKVDNLLPTEGKEPSNVFFQIGSQLAANIKTVLACIACVLLVVVTVVVRQLSHGLQGSYGTFPSSSSSSVSCDTSDTYQREKDNSDVIIKKESCKKIYAAPEQTLIFSTESSLPVIEEENTDSDDNEINNTDSINEDEKMQES